MSRTRTRARIEAAARSTAVGDSEFRKAHGA